MTPVVPECSNESDRVLYPGQYKTNTVKLGFKELLNKEQIGFKELFTDYQLFYTIRLLLNKELNLRNAKFGFKEL